jgi:protein-disulfide isomerase
MINQPSIENEAAQSRRRLDWRRTLDLLATFMTAAVGIWVMATLAMVRLTPSGSRPAPRLAPVVPSEAVSLDGATLRGQPSAKIALIEYSDFQCPYCGKFTREVLPTLLVKYVTTGRMLVAFRNVPLSMHPFARPAAEAAVCAGEQGKFWAAHDLFFHDQTRLGELVQALPADLGLAVEPYSRCLTMASRRVDADLSGARAVQVVGTPAFLIGVFQADGRVKALRAIQGAKPLAEFESQLDDVLALSSPRIAK